MAAPQSGAPRGDRGGRARGVRRARLRAARLEEVARRAGVTKGTVYLYFESKEALFKAVVRETIVPSSPRRGYRSGVHR